MPRYGVSLPFTATVYVEVEAENESDAIEKALEADYDHQDISEWETHRQTNRGNVAYGSCTEAYAEEIGDYIVDTYSTNGCYEQ